LFGNTYIGKNPTKLKNSFFVLHLDFSTIDPSGTIERIEKSFNHVCNLRLNSLVGINKQWFQDKITIDPKISPSANLQTVLDCIFLNQLPPLYVIIDEYDNFANHLIASHKTNLYRDLMSNEGFFKSFFKTLKEGRKDGTIANVFVTGVLPITIDELASGFNIATFITLDAEFENMLGFTQSEVDELVDQIYRDYEIDFSTRNEIGALIKNHYNGYHFVRTDGEAIYNSTILMYFLHSFYRYKESPKHLTDTNLRTDTIWIKRLTGSNPESTNEFVDQLTINNIIQYDDDFLVQKFNMSQFFEKGFFPISFFYLGMLTKKDDYYLQLPNLNMRQIFVEYFNEFHGIDVSTRYQDVMIQFNKDLNLNNLFAGYWKFYISQLPEAIFQKVNENFYRTTFFEICSRYLSRWFTWNVERSYPKGRTDLEFVGKYNEIYAGIRMVIEFKYYSNADFAKFKTTIDEFELQLSDTEQIAGYVEGLKQEYPEAKISQHVIYCFGNLGFKVFDVRRKS
jgi:hypothetical protein